MATYEVLGTNTKNTRWLIIKSLRAFGQATVNQLADAVEVKAVTVRHHLNTLQAEQLVEMEEERRGVGRPVHLYRLSQKAERLFPQTYHLLIDRLLGELKQTFPKETVRALIDSLASSMADDLRREVDGLPPEARRERLLEWLEERGLTASWHESDTGLELVSYHCPYRAIGHHHPELCRIDETLVQAAVDAEVERASCLRLGDTACTLVLHEVHLAED